MKIPESAVSVPTRPIAFGDTFTTTRMSEAQLDNARRLPEASLNTLAGPWQQEAMKLAQAPHVIAANQGLGHFRSFGEKTLKSIGSLVSQEIFEEDTNLGRFLEHAPELFSSFDVISSALRSVPFVGMAVGTIVSVAQILTKALKYRVPWPPQLEMDPDNDAAEVDEALRMIRSGGNWTPLFLPPPRGPENDEQGGWAMFQEEGGFRFGRGGEGFGFGCAPGDLFFVAKGVQSRISTGDVTIPNDSRTPRHSLILRKGENPVSMRERVFSIGEWYPGLAALGRSVWSMVGTAHSAAMFQVDGYALIAAWSEYHHSTARFRDAMDRWLGRELSNGSKRWKREMIAGYLSNVGAAFHDVRTADGHLLSESQLLDLAMDANRRPVAETVGMQATRSASNLVMRQYAASGTRLNALVSKNSPALLGDKALREHFLKERATLLDADRFDGVELDEVPDKGLRNSLLARWRTNPEGPTVSAGLAGSTLSFVDPVSAEKKRRQAAEIEWDTVPKPPTMTGLGVPTEPEATAGSGKVLAATMVAAAGLAGTALVLHRRKRLAGSRR